MRLLEAILDANHRALAGDKDAGLRPDDYAASLPLIALTCIDPRLNPLLPEVLGIPEDRFIWLRNAGNVITDPMGTTMRSLALATAIKGGREIAIIGHTDCQVCKVTMLGLLERFKALGVDRQKLPEDIREFFGISASERQNVLRSTGLVRQSPLIGPAVPVHGLLVELQSGKLEWIVNGYEIRPAAVPGLKPSGPAQNPSPSAFGDFAAFNLGEMKFPSDAIGQGVEPILTELHKVEDALHQGGESAPQPESTPPPVPPPKRVVPIPPPLPSKSGRAKRP
jgi:carbonic anhydrase